MRLGLILLDIFRPKMPYRFRGKYRIVKKPSMHDLLKMKRDFEREEQNMLILRHPYLTVEQSHGHMSESRKKNEYIDKVRAQKLEKFSKQITITDRLSHLRVTEAWD